MKLYRAIPLILATLSFAFFTSSGTPSARAQDVPETTAEPTDETTAAATGVTAHGCGSS